MNILNRENLKAISGGQAEQLVVTRKISIEEVSAKCVEYCLNSNTWPLDSWLTIFESCSYAELDLLDDRLELAPYLTVTYKKVN